MKLYMANEDDTLYTISQKFQIELIQLMSVNPHIDRTNTIISGELIHLPESAVIITENGVVTPDCPPVPEEDFILDWIPHTSAEKMAEADYDVLIIGSGAGGGAALWRLCEQWGNNGKRIGMVERGPRFLPTHIANVATINGENFRYYAPPEIVSLIGNELPQFSGMKLYYALGGRTLLWGAVTPRFSDFELANWPVPLREMEMYYNIAEKVMHVTRNYTKNSSITQVLLNRLRENGYFNATDIPMATDLDQTSYGRLHSNVFFSSILFLARALSHRPFDLALNTYAVQVVAEGNKVVGVRVMTPDKKSFFIRSKNVVLSASTLQTPRILLNSNIPGRAIGRYLTTHSLLVASAKLDTRGFTEPLGVLGIVIPELVNRPYRLQLQGPDIFFNYHYDKKPIKDIWETSFYGALGKVESRPENRVFIDPGRRDLYGVPKVQVSFSYSEQDIAVIRQMYDAILQASAAMQLQLDILEGVPAICLLPPGADNHDAGTCRMGVDPSTSATNPYGQIHGMKGLYVADNSVLPSTGASNPTLTTVALAVRTADHIAHQYSTDRG